MTLFITTFLPLFYHLATRWAQLLTTTDCRLLSPLKEQSQMMLEIMLGIMIRMCEFGAHRIIKFELPIPN